LYWFSNYNTITYNNFYHNTNYGIYIPYTCTRNIIHHNNFWQNNGAAKGMTDGRSQACNDDSNTWYDNAAKEGNYWSNWDGSGGYPIAGDAGAYDMYPLSTPVTPELSPIAVIVSALGLLCVAMLRKPK